MAEWIVDLWPKGKGAPIKVRLFASNQAAAIQAAKEMYPQYRPGAVKKAS